MKIVKYFSKDISKILKGGLMLTTVSIFYATSLLNIQSTNAQTQSRGTYQPNSNGQVLFYPADGSNPILVYNGRQRALAITEYDDATYTAFSGGGIYRSPDGQNLGGGGMTTRVYRGSQKVRAMITCQNAIFTAFNGGGIYRSPDGQNLGGGGKTARVYKGSQTVTNMRCYENKVITTFSGGSTYLSPNGNNLGGGGITIRLNR